MIYVIDASVAAKWFLEENLRDQALRLLDPEIERIAPDWIFQEVAHTVFKRWRDKQIGADQATDAIDALPELISEQYPSAVLARRALDVALTLGHPVYDSLYLVCAEIAGGPVVTADNDFFKAVRGTEFARYIMHLADLELPGAAP